MHNFKVLLYYKYVPVDSPTRLQKEQKELCERLHLKGRIIIADEGINGTFAGSPEEVDSYITETTRYPEFADMEWKVSWSDEQLFPKMRIVVRDEIVTLGIKKTGADVPISSKAQYIEPQELCALYESGEDFVILDARNAYEAELGAFKDALIPPIDAFREFPDFVKNNLSEYKERAVVTYCTGGVRCEKASAYLREQGFQNVRQLHGGVHEYAEKTGGKFFDGELFVFDKRLHVPVNSVAPTVISHCTYCQRDCTEYVDCVAPGCDGLIICCAGCANEHHSACSSECEAVLTRHQTQADLAL